MPRAHAHRAHRVLGRGGRCSPCNSPRAACCCPACPRATTTPGGPARWAPTIERVRATRRRDAARGARRAAGRRPGRLRLPDPERLLRAFLDAVADALPRSPAAPLVAGGPAYAAPEPQHLPEQRAWAADVAAGHDAGVRLSLRVEVPGLGRGAATDAALPFRAVLQMHSVSDPALVADAADVWAGTGSAAGAFGPRARMDALLALRRAARAWPPLAPLLSAAVPDAVELADEEVAELLGEAARGRWPRRGRGALAEGAGPQADRARGRRPAATTATGARQGLRGHPVVPVRRRAARLQLAVRAGRARQLTRAELDRLAEANRPLVRLRDQWVLIDPEEARRARGPQDRKVTPDRRAGRRADRAPRRSTAAGSTCSPPGWLEALRERLADPEAQAAGRRSPPPSPPRCATTSCAA